MTAGTRSGSIPYRPLTDRCCRFRARLPEGKQTATGHRPLTAMVAQDRPGRTLRLIAISPLLLPAAMGNESPPTVRLRLLAALQYLRPADGLRARLFKRE